MLIEDLRWLEFGCELLPAVPLVFHQRELCPFTQAALLSVCHMPTYYWRHL